MRARVLLAAALTLACACHGKSRQPRRDHASSTHELVELRLETMPEERETTSLGRPAQTLSRALGAIDEVATRSDRAGLFLRVDPLGSGSARAGEIAQALARVRARHKPVHCYFEVADNASYYLMSSSCDRISMTPAGHVMLVGVAAHLYSIRGLLEWAGVQMDMVQAGRAKGAADPFIRDEPSPEHRQNVERLVRSLNDRLVRSVAARTGLGDARPLLARGPFTSGQALEARLVDAVEFDDEARHAARVASHARRVTRVSLSGEGGPRTLTAMLARLSEGATDTPPSAPQLVVARVTGSIVDGSRSSSDSVAADPFVAAMRGFAADPNVKAIVVRIDSPGGSALASDRMWHAVYRARLRKPVVVSVGDMAASGGYYIACAGTEIYAGETSIVGSIGVVSGRPDMSALLARFGVRMHPIASTPSADVMMPFRPLTSDERQRFQASVAEAYERFLGRITTGRRIDRARLAEAAEGRVWVGTDALGFGLVDRLGSLRDAEARARELGHLGQDAPTHAWPPRTSLLEALLGGGDDAARVPLAGLDPALDRILVATGLALEGSGLPRAALPYALDVR